MNSDPEPVTSDGKGGSTGRVQLAILNKRFESVARKMANTLLRPADPACSTSRATSPAASYTRAGELLVTNEAYPFMSSRVRTSWRR